MLAQVLTPEELAGLTREVQNFAFDEAMVRLRAIAARFGTATAGNRGPRRYRRPAWFRVERGRR
jgi:hypothetical protein